MPAPLMASAWAAAARRRSRDGTLDAVRRGVSGFDAWQGFVGLSDATRRRRHKTLRALIGAIGEGPHDAATLEAVNALPIAA